MLASDRTLEALLDDGAIAVTPLEPEQIQPASIDVRLDSKFCWPVNRGRAVLDPREPVHELFDEREVPDGQAFLLYPQNFVLAATLERVTVGNQHVVTLEGCSSLGRLGLLVHATAGFIDPGFHGYITLELFNLAPLPIRLWPGMKIGQLAVEPLTTAARRVYGAPGLGSHYQNQPRGPQISQAWRNFRAAPIRQEQPADA